MADPIPPCAKCGHEKLYVVSPFEIRNYEYSNSSHPMPVALGADHEHDHASFELRVCARCGFSEWWTRDLAALAAAAGTFSKVRVVTANVAYR
jgi:predicted nucleic-acid-binding Zn-ribbon protein